MTKQPVFHVTLVEDDPLLRVSLRNFFVGQGFVVNDFETAESAFEFIQTNDTNVLVCDIVLPKQSGYQLFEKLSSKPHLGKIFISGKSEVEDRIKGLRLGADDYLCKPIDQTELLLRTKALLARLNYNSLDCKEESSELKLLDFSINIETRMITGTLSEIELGIVEFDLLAYLIAHHGKICNRKNISNILPPNERDIEGRSLDNLVARVRKKLAVIGSNSNHIVTFRSKGYMLKMSIH
ncbi:response regulator transcription factor [Paraglaciecola arctica]|uniref:Uncharacterized protein n=1 Tax=Paraglaciecola arctica BSs20135 TaxID=493475 RepID=K6XNL4_9ALTE|nr:response regulator transcription factor [Paraglaciecola arctica]GAC22239.1 hypothetical protein GARC_5304 [Paraglaciecola arctica BSs20135]|tara:strand:+ start:10756 stop:11469 length:714 start_codon:yes stop_codon:yes gene_type:complete